MALKGSKGVRKMSQTQDLIVDPEYEKFVVKTSKEEDDLLDQSIAEHGLLIPLVINSKKIILDGHRRFRSCQRLKIDPDTITKNFPSKTEEIIFVGESNLERRQLTPLQRIQLVMKLEPYYDELAKSRMKSGKKIDPVQIFAQGKTRDILGKKANVSGNTYEKGKKILENANDIIKEKTLSGKYSIDKTFKEIRKQEKKQKRQEQIKKIQVHLPENVQLFNQPFQQNQITDNSISLIFTDPPYTKEYLYLYEELAKQAIRVLKDGGSLLCYIGHYAIGTIIPMMEKHGLKFHWPIAVIHSGHSSTMWGYKVMVGYKLMLWFTKGKYEGEFVRDVIKSEFQGKELHEWAQSTKESNYYIKYLTIQNEIVYDPFLGQGTCGV